MIMNIVRTDDIKLLQR